jgi:hypothetical protein
MPALSIVRDVRVQNLLISPLEGEMSGRTEGGVKRTNLTYERCAP